MPYFPSYLRRRETYEKFTAFFFSIFKKMASLSPSSQPNTNDFQQERHKHNRARQALVKQKLKLLRKVIGSLWGPKTTLHDIQHDQTQKTSNLLENIPLKKLEQDLRAQLPHTQSLQPFHFTTVRIASIMKLSEQVEIITTIMRDVNLLGHKATLSQEDIRQIGGGGLPYSLQRSLVGIPRKKLDTALDHFHCARFEVTDEMKEKTHDGIDVVLFFTGTNSHWACTALYNVLNNNNIQGRREMLVDVALRGEGSVVGSGRAGVLNIDQCLRDTTTSSTSSLGGVTFFSNSLTSYQQEHKKVIISLNATGTSAVIQYEKLEHNKNKKKSKKSNGEKEITEGRSYGNPVMRRTIDVSKDLHTQLKQFPFQNVTEETVRSKGVRDHTLTANFIEQVRKLTAVAGELMMIFELNSTQSSCSSNTSSSCTTLPHSSSSSSQVPPSPSADAIYEVLDRVAANVYKLKEPNETHIDGNNWTPTGLTSACASGQSYHFPSEKSVELVNNELFVIRAFLRIPYTETSILVIRGSDVHAAPSISVPNKQKILTGDRVATPKVNHTGTDMTATTQVLERGSTCTYASRFPLKPDPLLTVVANPIDTYGDLFYLLKKGQYIVLYGCSVYRIKSFDQNIDTRGESVVTLAIVRHTTSPNINAEVSLSRQLELKLSEMENVGVFGGWASGRGGVRDEVGLVCPEKLQAIDLYK